MLLTHTFRHALAFASLLLPLLPRTLHAASPGRMEGPVMHPEMRPLPEPPLRVWVMPLVGTTPVGLGAGFGISLAVNPVMIGYRTLASEELCVMCQDAESMEQNHFLLGLRGEGAAGYAAVLSGLSRISEVRKENFVSNGSFFTDPDYDLAESERLAIPLVLEGALSGRFVGVGGSLMLTLGGDPAASFVLSLPIGFIHN